MKRKVLLSIMGVVIISVTNLLYGQNDFISEIGYIANNDVLIPRHTKRITTSSEEGYAICGIANNNNSHFVTKTDLFGNPLWHKRIGSADNIHPVMTVNNHSSSTFDGDIYVAGQATAGLRITHFDGATGSIVNETKVNTSFASKKITPFQIKPIEYNGDILFGIVGMIKDINDDYLHSSFTLIDDNGAIVYSKEYPLPLPPNPHNNGAPVAFERKSGTNNVIIAYGSGGAYLYSFDVNFISGNFITNSSKFVQINISNANDLNIMDIEEIPGQGDLVLGGQLKNNECLILLDNNNNLKKVNLLNPNVSYSNLVYDVNYNQRSNEINVLNGWFGMNGVPISTNMLICDYSGGSLTILGNTRLYDPNTLTPYKFNLPATFTHSSSGNIAFAPRGGSIDGFPLVVFNSSNNVTSCSMDPIQFNPKDFPFYSPSVFDPTQNSFSTQNISLNYIADVLERTDVCNPQCTSGQIPVNITATGSGICSTTGSGSVILTANASGGPYNYVWYPSTQTSSSITVSSTGTYQVTVSDPQTGCIGTASFNVTADDDPDPANYIITPNGTVCQNDNPTTFDLFPSNINSTNPSYSWDFDYGQTSTDASPQVNLNSNYGLRDITLDYTNACGTMQVISSITLEGHEGSIQTTQPLCASGTGQLCFNATASSSSLNYTWSNGGNTACISNLSAGTYTVTVSLNSNPNCSEVYSGVINPAPPAITFNPNTTDETCINSSDGEIVLNVSGGTPPYSYNWTGSSSTSGTATNLTNGTYSCTVTDANGCTSSSGNISINTANPGTGITFNPTVTNNTCFGACDGEIVLNPTISGSLTPTYQWNFGATTQDVDNLCGGDYSVNVSTSACPDYRVDVNIDPNADSYWQVYSQDSQSETKSVDVESDDDGNIYVTGYFEGSASFNNGDVTINSGSSPRGLFLVKYDKCANFEWVGYTTSGSVSTNYEGVDIEYRNGEIIILGSTSNQNINFDYLVKDNTNTNINSTLIIQAQAGDGYFIGRSSTDALTLNNFNFVDRTNSYTNEEFTSIDIMSSSNLQDFILAGKNNGELFISEVSYNGTNDYVITSNNYTGSLDNSINDIERRVGTQELYITGEYINSTLLGSSYTILGSSDAYTAVISGISNLSNIPSNSYIHVGEANQTAAGNEVDINELATGEVQVYTTGHYNEALTGWNYPSASGGGMVSAGGIDNAFISSSTFEPQGPFIKNWAVDFTGNDFIEAEGQGIIYDESGDRILATGTFISEEIHVPNQSESAPGNGYTNMWNIAISLNGDVQWMNSGTTNKPIEVAGIAAYGVNGFIAGSYTSDIDLTYNYQSPVIPYIGSSGTQIFEMFIARCGNALTQSQGSMQGQFYKKDPFADKSDNAVSLIQDNEHKFNVYPNPTRGDITIEWKSELEENWSVNIYSGTGVNVYSNSLDASNNMIKINEFSHLSKGVYFVKVSQGNLIETTRLVIQ
ncbi:T9SS type A sorting domain-containing protein [Salibacter halophilus]|uniref:T9SS type A sorting domain-containing protein n=1 Tax=Salibacter halophilus TaxID=1803916 RepID=A0A6N6M5F6_9FLAO|nr:T9SS type A sorting domain-containing protein [Salibacter halophilus]KAB1064753.1 T9SS type A sorting domain-containing protein [Salibacter halophilus]